MLGNREITGDSLFNGGKKRRLIYVCAGIGVLGLIALAFVWVVRQQHSPEVHHTAAASVHFSQATAEAAVSEADAGDYEKTEQELTDQAGRVSDAVDRQGIYITQAAIALNAKKYDDAGQYAVKAEAAKQTDASAAILGDVALAKGDTTAARDHYQTAIDRLDTHSHSYAARLRTYKQKLGQTGS